MTLKIRKIAIVGTGLVGSTTAFSLITQGICDEVLMIDINEERAKGEALDLIHCGEYLDRNTKIKTAHYSECGDVDIVVITAGAPPKQGQSRLDTLEISAKIAKSIVEPIMESGFNGYFIVISNPVDIIAAYVKEVSGLPKNKVIGTGTALDSARLKSLIGELLDINPKSVQAYSMGEHGDSQMVPWSHVYVGGKKFSKILKDNKERVGNVDLDDLVYKTTRAGWEVFNRKGTTYYGIAATVSAIIKAILNDENKMIPVSAYLDGEYGQWGIYAGVPAILNNTGVKEIVEIDLTEDEQIKFNKSCDLLKKYVRKLDL